MFTGGMFRVRNFGNRILSSNERNVITMIGSSQTGWNWRDKWHSVSGGRNNER